IMSEELKKTILQGTDAILTIGDSGMTDQEFDAEFERIWRKTLEDTESGFSDSIKFYNCVDADGNLSFCVPESLREPTQPRDFASYLGKGQTMYGYPCAIDKKDKK